jgi:putative ATP-dependent endonuclease of the OLD family
MALLSLAAKVQKNSDNFQLLLGVEEPELYQHPPQARFLANALATLSEGNCQAIITTHSPNFVSGRLFDKVRVLRKSRNSTRVYFWTIDEQRAYCAARKGVEAIGASAALSGIDRALQPSISEMFFAARVILVEGQEDIAIIESYLRKVGKLSDFLRAGCHFVGVGGKTKMPMLVSLARGFGISVYCIVDFDMNQVERNRQNAETIRYALDVGDIVPEQPAEEFSGNYYYGWLNTIQHSLEEECATWRQTRSEIAGEWGWSLDRMSKDPMLLEETVARIVDTDGDIIPLRRLANRLEQFWQQP